MRNVYGTISLISLAVGVVTLLGLVVFVVQGTQTGASSAYGAMLPFALIAAVAFVVAYVTRRMRG